MPSVTPSLLLLASGGVTLAVLVAATVELKMRRARLRALASDAGCEYQPYADSSILQAVLPRLGALGAADVRLIDLLVCAEDGAQLCIGRVDYALGVVRHRRDNTRIIAIRTSAPGEVRSVEFAPRELARREQYMQLLESAGRLTGG